MTPDTCSRPRCRRPSATTYLGSALCQTCYHAFLDAVEASRPTPETVITDYPERLRDWLRGEKTTT